MKSRFRSFLSLAVGWWLVLFLCSRAASADPSPSSVALFNAYVGEVQLRLAQQHRSVSGFLARPPSRSSDSTGVTSLVVERLSPPATGKSSDVLIHHWRATAFAPGATTKDVEQLLRAVDSYPRVFAPQVLMARVIRRDGDQMSVWMRLRQHHILTVILDSTYDVTFGRLDAQHGFSISRSSRIVELASSATEAERPPSPTEEHGFLWQQMNCWSYEERAGGVYLQLESVSLSRSIPRGLAWAVSPYVESIPRDSLTFTMHSVIDALGTH